MSVKNVIDFAELESLEDEPQPSHDTHTLPKNVKVTLEKVNPNQVGVPHKHVRTTSGFIVPWPKPRTRNEITDIQQWQSLEKVCRNGEQCWSGGAVLPYTEFNYHPHTFDHLSTYCTRCHSQRMLAGAEEARKERQAQTQQLQVKTHTPVKLASSPKSAKNPRADQEAAIKRTLDTHADKKENAVVSAPVAQANDAEAEQLSVSVAPTLPIQTLNMADALRVMSQALAQLADAADTPSPDLVAERDRLQGDLAAATALIDEYAALAERCGQLKALLEPMRPLLSAQIQALLD